MNLILGKAIKPLSNIGVGKIPGVLSLYKYLWRYFGPKGIRLTKVNGFKMYVICCDWAVAPTMLFSHTWEPSETQICREHIKEGMTVIDAGAYIGYYSLLASKLVGSNGKVYSFEPLPQSLELLNMNIRENNCNNISVFAKAVSDKTEESTFYVSSTNLSGSTMFSDYPPLIEGVDSHQVKISTTTLDEALSGEKVDFIKMDIEGGEINALKGMANVIKGNPNLKMIVEVFPIGLVGIGSSLEEYIEILMGWFHLYIINETGLTGEVALGDIQKALKKTAVINLFCKRRANA